MVSIAMTTTTAARYAAADAFRIVSWAIPDATVAAFASRSLVSLYVHNEAHASGLYVHTRWLIGWFAYPGKEGLSKDTTEYSTRNQPAYLNHALGVRVQCLRMVQVFWSGQWPHM